MLTDSGAQGESSTWIYALLSIAILTPLLQGSTTGAISASLWRTRKGALGMAVIAAAILIHIAFVVGTLLIQASGQTQVIWLAWQTLLVGLILVTIRHLLHSALLEEAGHMGLVPRACPGCNANVTAAGFCPNCGRALSAVTETNRATAVGATTSEGV